jgi:hypothetical protein
MTADVVTAMVLTGFLPIWAFREAWVGAKGDHTISQVARALAWRFSAFVYFWSSMVVHWWVPMPFTSSAPKTIAFWGIEGVLLVWNAAAWTRTGGPLADWPPWLRWVNWPLWYVALGPLAAALLFPQNQSFPWAP